LDWLHEYKERLRTKNKKSIQLEYEERMKSNTKSEFEFVQREIEKEISEDELTKQFKRYYLDTQHETLEDDLNFIKPITIQMYELVEQDKELTHFELFSLNQPKKVGQPPEVT
jgi:hypothetical protein